MPKVPFWIFVIIAALYFSAVRVDIMDIDATQYAEISREMANSGDYLHLYDRGHNYLDKPPFLFWLSAASIKLFGVTNFAYKFPSILLALLAIFATYRLGKLLYNENIGRVAALILATSQGMFLMTNDIRCDLALMAWVVCSIWLLQEWIIKKHWYYWALAACAIAFGMMTKGPIALLLPIFAFGAHWFLKRDWKQFLRWQYFPMLLIIAILLLPMCIGLYQQYDMHPEAIVDGQSRVSGLRFYFWTQSFGRITGENVWNNNAGISFQLENMLWSFLPWIFILIPAIILNFKNLLQQKLKLKEGQEWLTTGGFVLGYLAVGLSKYQLPHYIFPVFPLAAIVCASFINDCFEKKYKPTISKLLTNIMAVVGTLLFIATFLLMAFVFPAAWYWYLFCALGLTVFFFIALRQKQKGKLIWLGASVMILVNVFLTHHFYFELMKYQVGTQVGKYIREHKIDSKNIVAYKMNDPLNSMHYYADQVIAITDKENELNESEIKYVLTEEKGLKELQDKGFNYSILIEKKRFKVSELTPDFVNIKTRDKATATYYFCKIISRK